MNPILKDYQKSIKKLKDILDIKKTEINRDSALKRFELCFDLAWKSIKEYARKEGVECQSPRACFKTAFQLKLIEYDELWLQMIDDRNKSVHIYKEEFADEIYANLNGYIKLFKELLEVLNSKDKFC